MKVKFRVIGPDSIPTNQTLYDTWSEAYAEIDRFVKKYEPQGYYSTIVDGTRVRISIAEIAGHCFVEEVDVEQLAINHVVEAAAAALNFLNQIKATMSLTHNDEALITDLEEALEEYAKTE